MRIGPVVLEAQGIKPLLFLVMPRVLAMVVSAFCLTVIFVLVAFASGYRFGVFIGQAGAKTGEDVPLAERFNPMSLNPVVYPPMERVDGPVRKGVQ